MQTQIDESNLLSLNIEDLNPLKILTNKEEKRNRKADNNKIKQYEKRINEDNKTITVIDLITGAEVFRCKYNNLEIMSSIVNNHYSI